MVGGAEVVVVELDEDVVELRVVDHVAHVGFEEGTLWQAGDGVSVCRALEENRPKLVDQDFVICVFAVLGDGQSGSFDGFMGMVAHRIGFDVEIPSFDEAIAERSRGIGLWTPHLDCRINSKEKRQYPQRLLVMCNVSCEGFGSNGTRKWRLRMRYAWHRGSDIFTQA